MSDKSSVLGNDAKLTQAPLPFPPWFCDDLRGEIRDQNLNFKQEEGTVTVYLTRTNHIFLHLLTVFIDEDNGVENIRIVSP